MTSLFASLPAAVFFHFVSAVCTFCNTSERDLNFLCCCTLSMWSLASFASSEGTCWSAPTISRRSIKALIIPTQMAGNEPDRVLRPDFGWSIGQGYRTTTTGALLTVLPRLTTVMTPTIITRNLSGSLSSLTVTMVPVWNTIVCFGLLIVSA